MTKTPTSINGSSTVGIFLGTIAYRLSKRKLALAGIVLNAIVLLLPLIYCSGMVIG